MATGKGKFSTDIGEDVIAAAVNSVDRRTRSGESPAEDGTRGVAPPPEGATPPGEAEPPSGAEPASAEEAAARVRELEAQVRSEHELLLRAAADLDNYRKRAQRDLQDGVRFANERLIKDFLPVLDNLERALGQGGGARDWAALEQGLLMTRKHFEDTLARHGARPVAALGQPFDPNLHEAMGTTESTEAAPNTVVSEILRGWTLNDRLVRPALVSVARAPGAPAPPASGGEEPVAAPAEERPER
ncbi:MAG TPA: nucleotide exchange factor GrpE [Myxococcaceae bacterium]|nr:nucleotide exchange factor GrpE [Myxococcaceae bacterium]